MSDEQDEWFRTTSSWVWAAVAAAVAALVAIVDAVQGWHPVVTAGAVLFLVVAYAAFVRPRVGVRGGDVVLDHLYSTQTFPLAALEKVTVRRLLMLEAGGHTYTSGAIGRSSRELRREARGRVRRDDRTGAGQVTAKAPE
ncbi:MAG: hypothetical protein J2O46_04700, partial [Nocardioides sp.]|nr:hypothetical protein [Nocardioides sp.]